MKNVISSALFAVSMLLVSTAAMASDAMLKPFVLASKGPGTVAEKVTAAKAALTANGFTIAGEYSPYPDADIVVVTNDELKNNAAQSEHGGFGAIQRVAITKVGDDIEVSYTNPVYMANAYRMQGDLQNVAAKLQTALGKVEDFGAKEGMSADDLRDYHYMFGMEYFTDPSVLASFGSHQEALDAVEKGLASNTVGASKVYRVDIPGKDESVFGVGLKAPTDAKKYMDDKFIMSVIDFKDPKSTAHLPYEVLVSGNKVFALYARFRIAINFPDLSMMGSHSFMNIMGSPEAIRKALQKAVNGK